MNSQHTSFNFLRPDEPNWSQLGYPYVAPDISSQNIAAPAVLYDHRELPQQMTEELLELGTRAYLEGHVGFALVAGGQGSRLEYQDPKGCYPIFNVGESEPTPKSLFEWQCGKWASACRRYGTSMPAVIMTSLYTDERTKEFFVQNDFFGVNPDTTLFFSQGMLPSVDLEGRTLFASPHSLLLNPDGHGGFYTAINQSGLIRSLRARGCRYLVYGQVDNLLLLFDDPMLVGTAIKEEADIVVKVIEKNYPDEKLGHLVQIGGRLQIIEYTDVDEEDVRMLGPDSMPLLRWGSPSLFCVSVDFLERAFEAGFRLPVHLSRKSFSAYFEGQQVCIEGNRSETFFHDLLLFPGEIRSVGYVVPYRDREFAPVKRAMGLDSAETARELVAREHTRWFSECGFAVSSDTRVLIDSKVAGSFNHFREVVSSGRVVMRDSPEGIYVYPVYKV